jgi:cytochrome c oxidase subunit 4
VASKAHSPNHVVPLRIYIAVGLALFALTGLTVAMSFVHLGGWNAVIAFGIAAVKTALVAAVFMHLWYDRKMYLLVFLTAIAFLAVFIAFTMFDVLDRTDLYDVVGHPIQSEAAMYEGRTVTPGEHGEAAAEAQSTAPDAGEGASDSGAAAKDEGVAADSAAPAEHESP